MRVMGSGILHFRFLLLDCPSPGSIGEIPCLCPIPLTMKLIEDMKTQSASRRKVPSALAEVLGMPEFPTSNCDCAAHQLRAK